MSERWKRRRSFFDIVSDYFEQLEDWFESLIEPFERPSWNERECCLEPLCNIFVSPTEVVVTADLPYSESNTIKVQPISDDTIEISAKLRRTVSFDDFGVTHRKGEFSSYKCQLRIPVPVDMEQMEIRFKKGILEVHLPRKRGYRIKVE